MSKVSELSDLDFAEQYVLHQNELLRRLIIDNNRDLKIDIIGHYLSRNRINDNKDRHEEARKMVLVLANLTRSNMLIF